MQKKLHKKRRRPATFTLSGYSRRNGAWLPCSVWERACPPRLAAARSLDPTQTVPGNRAKHISLGRSRLVSRQWICDERCAPRWESGGRSHVLRTSNLWSRRTFRPALSGYWCGAAVRVTPPAPAVHQRGDLPRPLATRRWRED